MAIEPKREPVKVDLPSLSASIGTVWDHGGFMMVVHNGTVTCTEDDGSKVELDWNSYITGAGFCVEHASGLRIEVNTKPLVEAAAAALMEQVKKRAAGDLPPLAGDNRIATEAPNGTDNA